jgi:hypothetical protein
MIPTCVAHLDSRPEALQTGAAHRESGRNFRNHAISSSKSCNCYRVVCSQLAKTQRANIQLRCEKDRLTAALIDANEQISGLNQELKQKADLTEEIKHQKALAESLQDQCLISKLEINRLKKENIRLRIRVDAATRASEVAQNKKENPQQKSLEPEDTLDILLLRLEAEGSERPQQREEAN